MTPSHEAVVAPLVRNVRGSAVSGGCYFFTSPRTAHLLINLRANPWDSLKSAFRTSFTRRGREFASTVVQVFPYACGRQHRLGRFIRRRVPTRFREPRVRSSRRAARTAEWHLGLRAMGLLPSESPRPVGCRNLAKNATSSIVGKCRAITTAFCLTARGRPSSRASSIRKPPAHNIARVLSTGMVMEISRMSEQESVPHDRLAKRECHGGFRNDCVRSLWPGACLFGAKVRFGQTILSKRGQIMASCTTRRTIAYSQAENHTPIRTGTRMIGRSAPGACGLTEVHVFSMRIAGAPKPHRECGRARTASLSKRNS